MFGSIGGSRDIGRFRSVDFRTWREPYWTDW